MTASLTDYASLITSEHQSAPRFMAMVSLLAQWGVDRRNLLASIQGAPGTQGAITANVSPVGIPQIFQNDWQGNQLLFATPRTNLVLQSQTFTNAAWNQTSNGLLSVTGSSGTAPDGTNTATLLTENTANSTHLILATSAATITAGGSYTVSVFAKAGTRNKIGLFNTTSNNGFHALFDLSAGSVISSGPDGTGTILGATITNIGNGWFKCSVSGKLDPSATALNPRFELLNAAGANSYTGDGVSGLLIWGAQIESGIQATSYIPTTTSAVTVTDYMLSGSGLVTLATPPLAGAALTWTGTGTDDLAGGTVTANNKSFGTGDGLTNSFQLTETWGAGTGVSAVPGLYDIDSAIGQQLDRVGEWVGITRNLALPLTNVYFSFDTAGLGFDQGAWQGPFDPTTGLVALPDDQYRILLYATIAANNWDGTVPGAYTAWNTVFAPLGYSILIADNQNMTMDIVLVGPAPDAVTLALFTGGYLNLRPAGVGINNYYLPTVPDIPVFGFDVENSAIAGFDVGAWAAPLPH